MEAYRRIDAYPDVKPALARLRQGGARVFILSNGTEEMLADAAAASGIAGLLDGIISADVVRIYKTDARVYALVEKHADAPRGQIAFVSSNRWDVAGAVRYGFPATWVNRTDQPDEYADLAPRNVVRTLAELAP